MGSGSGQMGGRRARWAAAASAGVVLTCAGAFAASGVIATAGGNDQQAFHLPSVLMIRETAPLVDVIHLPTASGPLYYLAIAAISGLLGLNVVGMQVVGALFAAALAALAVWHARSVPGYLRILAVAPLLFSAYFWQSAAWMMTDDAALLFAMAALILLTQDNPSGRRQLAIGLLLAAAVATRQTYVWAMAPAVAIFALARPRAWRVAVPAMMRVSGPAVVTLAVLVTAWGGLTPPAMRQFNSAQQSWTAISYVFAVSAIFVLPVALAVKHIQFERRSVARATLIGVAAGLPAVVFPSAATSAPDESRRGGVVWTLAANFPDIAGRSPVLVLLAFIGAFACTMIVCALDRPTAVMLAAGILALAFATAGGAQLYQRYVELPVAMMTVLVIVSLVTARRIQRTWPLVCLAVYQVLITGGIVVLPLTQAALHR